MNKARNSNLYNLLWPSTSYAPTDQLSVRLINARWGDVDYLAFLIPVRVDHTSTMQEQYHAPSSAPDKRFKNERSIRTRTYYAERQVYFQYRICHSLRTKVYASNRTKKVYVQRRSVSLSNIQFHGEFSIVKRPTVSSHVTMRGPYFSTGSDICSNRSIEGSKEDTCTRKYNGQSNS